VIRQHRREERLKVGQGKTPYYLKEKEIKERALVEKYKGLKSKERERLMERRQRKEGQKEKKRMPNARRMAG
jgi:ribosomal RNA-processing protein 36